MKLKMLVYGDPGVGKTVFAAGADKAVLFDVEGGALSIQQRINSKKVIHKRIETFQELEDAVITLREKQGQKGGPETIIIDSITEVQKKLMDHIVSANPELKRPYGDGLTLSDWGYNTERMRRFIRMVRDLDYNIVLTALAMGVKDEATGAISTMPSLSQKLAADVCGYMDIVGYLYVDEEDGQTVRRMLTQPKGHYYAKDRSGQLDTIITNPTYNAVHSAVFGQ